MVKYSCIKLFAIYMRVRTPQNNAVDFVCFSMKYQNEQTHTYLRHTARIRMRIKMQSKSKVQHTRWNCVLSASWSVFYSTEWGTSKERRGFSMSGWNSHFPISIHHAL